MMGIKYKKIDFVTLCCYLVLVIFGWMNIFSSSAGDGGFVWSLSSKYVMDLIWVASSLIIGALIIFAIPPRAYSAVAWPLYILIVFLLVAVAFVGVEVNGSKSWFAIGPFRLQPAEFSKISTALAIAYLLDKREIKFSLSGRNNVRDLISIAAVLVVPMLAILLEKETGSALVYLGFLLVFYREGMSGWVLILGLLAILFFILTLVLSPWATLLILIGLLGVIGSFGSRKLHIGGPVTLITVLLLAFFPRLYNIEGFDLIHRFEPEVWVALISLPPVLFFTLRSLIRRQKFLRNILLGYLLGICLIFSVQFVFDNVLKDHQRARIEVLLGIREDPKGVGYNVNQSLIAIGSGGLAGKGFLQGTQTRFDFVPEQSTDFIFCTIGEEWGFFGSLLVLSLYLTMILRILNNSEKQKDKFNRIFGYCTASCLLMHVLINISMTIGLMPVIGIPLPLLSYGGSSLWAFTILIFIYLRLDLERWK